MSVKNVTRKRTGQFSGIQIMFAAILAIGLFLTIDFSGRITASQPVFVAYERVQAEIEQLRLEQGALIAERDYVRSDAYVSEWARAEGRMVQPGDRLVVIVPSGAPAPEEAADNPIAQQTVVETTLPDPDLWTLWWSLFFDNAPPAF